MDLPSFSHVQSLLFPLISYFFPATTWCCGSRAKVTYRCNNLVLFARAHAQAPLHMPRACFRFLNPPPPPAPPHFPHRHRTASTLALSHPPTLSFDLPPFFYHQPRPLFLFDARADTVPPQPTRYALFAVIHLALPTLCFFTFRNTCDLTSYRRNDILGLHQCARLAAPRLRHRHCGPPRHTHRYKILSAHTRCAAYLGLWPVLAFCDVAGTFFFGYDLSYPGGRNVKKGENITMREMKKKLTWVK